MSKKVLIIATSPRRGGNSETLAQEFAKGACDAGHQVEVIYLRDKNIGFCKGCGECHETGRCVNPDDAAPIVEKMLTAQVIAFATPVYFYDMCGQMKTLLDRTLPLYSANYAFRDIYLLATAEEDDESAIDGTITGVSGWISCYEKASLKGVVRGVALADVGDVKGKPVLKEAFKAGKTL